MQVEGQQGEEQSSPLATGARVSNTYGTCPQQGDKRKKFRLIPRNIPGRHLPGIKDLSAEDGHAAH